MRDTTQLHPELQILMDKHIKLCEENGYKIKITECLRSIAEQDALYAQGRTKPGKIVTNAKGSTYSSFHMWGLAYDIIRADGKNPYDTSDGFFDKVGALGESIGLTWGGSWKSFKDKPHFQLDKYGSTSSALKQKYGTPDNFFKTWPSIESLVQETEDEKYGEKLEEETFAIKSKTYLRTSPTTGNNKVNYSDLSDTLKKKCIKDENGYAIIDQDKTFTRIRSYVDENENKWMQMKSGYWISAIYNDKKKIKNID